MIKNSKYISTITILEAIARESDYDNVNLGDVVEWLWEVIEHLSIPMYYIDTTSSIDVLDYRGILPSKIESIDQVRDYYSKIPLLPTSNIFYKSPNKTSTAMPVAILNVDGGTETLDSLSLTSRVTNEQYQYKVENGYIYTEFPECKLEIAYKTYPIDAEGFPMIPEDIYFIKAVRSFIIMKLDKKQWRKGLLPENIYRDSEQDYYFCAAQAKGHAALPDLDMLEKIRRFSALLVSDTNGFNKSFNNLGA